MSPITMEAQLVQRALQGDRDAVRALVDLLTPVVQTRVVRVLRRARARRCYRGLRQEVADFTQSAFLAMFDDDARALRSWDPARGVSLKNFVGAVAEHQAISLLRRGRTNPWLEEPTDCDVLDLELGATPDGDERFFSREMLEKLLDRLRAELTPNGLLLFQILLVEGRAVPEVCEHMGMTPDAVYAWRSRLGKLARRLAQEMDFAAARPVVAGSREMKETAP